MTTEAAALTAGRAMAEARMQESIRLSHPGPDVYDPVTGETTTSSTLLYTGKAQVKPLQSMPEDVQAGQREAVLMRYEVKLPFAAVPAAPVLPGDTATVDTSPDPRMPGLVLHVTGVAYSATATAWRISAEDRS
ncbi:DUF6093 family protein [Kitasatospora sp. NPDC058406]|uniref:DUF6093 family protein n=1 Tax=Kitasatospora sp. NPDC058406 TaxID=3346483 RepID=UPI00365E16DB